MIGQDNLKKAFKARDEFPPLIVLIGADGCGKTTAARYIANEASAKAFYISGNKIDEVRETVEQAYSQVANVFYFFKNAQDMTMQAQNVLLKLTEEPPHKAKVIISVNDKSNILLTLLSRAFVYNFMPYSNTELTQFATAEGLKYEDDILLVARTPGDLKLIQTFNFGEMLDGIIDFIRHKKIIKGLALVKKLKLKEDDEGYDVLLFLRAFEIYLQRLIKDNIEGVHKALCKISGVRQALNYTGVNKKMLLENLTLEIMEGL